MIETRNRRGVFGMLAMALTLVVLGAWATYEEASVYFNSGSTSLRRLSLLPPTGAAPGLAPSSQSSTIGDCYVAMLRAAPSHPYTLSSGLSAEMQARCADIAEHALARRPADALAWTVAAGTAAAGGQWQVFNTNLRAAQALAPSEQWIAELRVELAETYYGALNAAVLAGHDADLAMLVRSDRGVLAIADRYIAQENFRNRVTEIVEALPEERQRKFLNVLNRKVTLRRNQSLAANQ